MPVGTIHRRVLWLVVAGRALLAMQSASAQPVVDQALADAQLAVEKGCAILKVTFNIRIRYASHFPLDQGDELRITVNPIDRNQAAALLALRREAATVPNGRQNGIRAIDLETDSPTGPVLRILFDRPMAYQVAPNSDTQSIVVAIAGAKPSAKCKPVFPSGAGFPTPPFRDGVAAARPMDRPVGKISDSDLRAVAAWMDESRAALRKANLAGAIQLLTRILKYPENQYSAEAQELLGVARQKSGQLGAARAEYEDYLRRYPSGEQSERVRQRLAGIVTATGEPGAPLHAPNGQPVGMPPTDRFAPSRETTWTLVGSASAFYIRDDSFNSVRDPSVAPDPNADPDAHRVHQNEMLTSLDLTAAWNNDQTKGRIRFSGSEEYLFDSNSKDLAGVAALFVDTTIKEWNLRSVFGRQTLNTDGVLGRFDGALLSWQALSMLRLDVVAGSPAISRFDLPFKEEKYFYGAGIGLGPFNGFETTLSFDLGFAGVNEPICVLTQESLAQIGIKTTINKIPGANWRTELTKKVMPLYTNVFSGWLDYPEYFFIWCYHGKNSIFNTMSYQSKAMDALIEGASAAAAIGDQATYDKDVRGFVDLAFADIPRIPLYQPYVNVAMQKNISGYQYWFHRRLDYRALAKG